MAKDSITVSHHDGYPVASMWEPEILEIDKVDLDIVDVIAKDVDNQCRMNAWGLCWNFKQTDSRIITISHTKAALVDFDARIDDADTSVRMIVLPTDSGVWVLRGMAKTADTMQAVRDALDTFVPVSGMAADSSKETRPAAAQSPERWAPNDPSLVLEKEITINMIMIGQKWSTIDTARILEKIPAYNDPVFTTTGEKVGIRYHHTYNFVSDVENTNELLRVMKENSREQPVFGSGVYDFDFWQASWVQNHPHLKDAQYRLVDAAAVEEYMRDVIIGTNRNVDKSDSAVNLIFLNIPYDDSQHIQNYYIETTDRSTGKKVDYVGLMGFGGDDKDNIFFFDMWAVPWVDDTYKEWHYWPVNTNNMHDCQKPDCTANIVLEHTESAIYQILTPSFLYPVTFHESYFLDILVYLKPGGRVTVTPAVLDHFMNKDEIIREMQYLYPHAEWDAEMSIERKDMRGLSLEFKKQFENIRKEQIEVLGRTVHYAYLNSTEITPHLVEWAQQRQAERQQMLGNDTWTIPILIVIDNTDAKVLIDGNAIGIAPGMPDDESQPCCALAVADATDVWENEIALDNLILHEAGHVMGLHHPFVSFEYGQPSYDFYYNWYSSPMTYSSPDGWGACGLLYAIFYDDTCGNANTSFTKFERERLTDARLVSLLKKIDQDTDDMPVKIAEQVAANVTDIKLMFASSSMQSETSALQAALAVYEFVQSDWAHDAENATESSQDAKAEYATMPKDSEESDAQQEEESEQQTEDVVMPKDSGELDTQQEEESDAQQEETKDTAMPKDSEESDIQQEQTEDAGLTDSKGKDDDDNDNDNATTSDAPPLQMTPPKQQQAQESDMIQDDSHSQDNSTSYDSSVLPAEQDITIPAWVKNSAGWWSDGLIDDHEFISSIEYMLDNNIMIIHSGNDTQQKNTDGDDQGIPAWVKNSAGWWSDGLLGDEEFINSLKYMISNGLIQV